MTYVKMKRKIYYPKKIVKYCQNIQPVFFIRSSEWAGDVVRSLVVHTDVRPWNGWRNKAKGRDLKWWKEERSKVSDAVRQR